MKIEIKSIEESPNYVTDPEFQDYRALEMSGVVITKGGMQSGNPSLDLQFVDEHGKRYVAMVQGNIFRSIAQIASVHYKDGGV